LVGSFPSCAACRRRHHPPLLCLVTGVADGAERRGARRRSVRRTVQGWPGPSATGRIPDTNLQTASH
jgi:hypothetical protein